MLTPTQNAVIKVLTLTYLAGLKWWMNRELSTFSETKARAAVKIIQRLAGYTTEALAEALKDYKWIKQTIDHISSPLITAYTKQGDCGEAAWLLNAIRPAGQCILICNIAEDGKLKKYESWHWIYLEDNGNVWSSSDDYIRLAVADVADIKKWVKKKYRWANLAIMVKSDFSGLGSIWEL